MGGVYCHTSWCSFHLVQVVMSYRWITGNIGDIIWDALENISLWGFSSKPLNQNLWDPEMYVFLFYSSRVDLQCCVNFYCVAK